MPYKFWTRRATSLIKTTNIGQKTIEVVLSLPFYILLVNSNIPKLYMQKSMAIEQSGDASCTIVDPDIAARQLQMNKT